MFDPKHSVHQAEPLLEKLKHLLATARENFMPVVFVQNNGSKLDPDQTGSEGWKLHPDLVPTDEEMIIQKFQCDAFDGTILHSLLQMLNVTDLIIAGLQTDYCIQTNCIAAHALGYQVILVRDAHSTYDSNTESAHQIIQRVNIQLEKVVATINAVEFQ
jgi:nicotinamidase-related amidase